MFRPDQIRPCSTAAAEAADDCIDAPVMSVNAGHPADVSHDVSQEHRPAGRIRNAAHLRLNATAVLIGLAGLGLGGFAMFVSAHDPSFRDDHELSRAEEPGTLKQHSHWVDHPKGRSLIGPPESGSRDRPFATLQASAEPPMWVAQTGFTAQSGFPWEQPVLPSPTIRRPGDTNSVRSSMDPLAQRGQAQGRGGGFFGGGRRGREIDRSDYPQWEVADEFQNDVFTFARIQYDGRGRTPDARWNNDYPDADLNFSFRLQQLTAMEVDPDGVVVRLDDEKLFNYPFAFMVGVTGVNFSPDEAAGLRKYLLNGGFLMVDDFWTPSEWRHIEFEMKKVFPNVTAVELTRDHPIFHLVYELQGIPRCPSIRAWERGDTFEYWHGDPEGDEDPHFMGYHDPDGRLVAVMCLNNDICDGWEREGENKEFFNLFSQRVSYPLGINIVVYAMSH